MKLFESRVIRQFFNLYLLHLAEETLNGIILNIENLTLFFNYISTKNIDINLRKSACIFLKKYIKDYWFDNTEMALTFPQKLIQDNTKEYFKTNIITLLLQAEQSLSPLVKEMINCIIQQAEGYITIWPNLMTKLGEILNQKNYTASTEVYDLIKKVIKRYHIEGKSRLLFAEIINTMQQICPILTEDGLKFSKFLAENKVGTDALPCMILLKRILQIFYSLNFQDFPEFFEDNLDKWIEILLNCLKCTCDVPELYKPFLALKTKTLKGVNLYFTNYFEDIQNYANQFYPVIWNLNYLVKSVDSYSGFTKELLQFYGTNFQYKRISNLKQEDVNALISILILPNIKMTENEKEEFEDNPVSFLKSELQEVDLDSNKYYSINLLKSLISLDPSLITTYINPTIQKFLSDYQANRNKCWNDKITAINLIFATHIKTFASRSNLFLFTFN